MSGVLRHSQSDCDEVGILNATQLSVAIIEENFVCDNFKRIHPVALHENVQGFENFLHSALVA